MTVQSPPPPGAPQPPKKGLGPLAWIGIGCGAIIVIGFIVMAAGAYLFKTKVVDPFQKNPGLAAAKLVVQANPDLDLVGENDDAHTLTVRNKKTNETVTIGFDDIKNGRLKFSSSGQGTASLDLSQQGVTVKAQDANGKESTFVAAAGAPKDLPSWLPTYPGGTVQGGGFSSKSAEATTQSFSVTTTDSLDKLIAFYQDQLKGAGFNVAPPTTISIGGRSTTSTLHADSSDQKRQVQIMATSGDGKTQASVTYVEKP